jgi:hypothetical protein
MMELSSSTLSLNLNYVLNNSNLYVAPRALKSRLGLTLRVSKLSPTLTLM